MVSKLLLVNDLLYYLNDIYDGRIEEKIFYPMDELLLVGISSVICGGEGWQDMRELGESKLELFRQILPFRHGIASAYTFENFFSALDPEHFEECLVAWVEDFRGEASLSIAVDGKTVRRSYDKKKGQTAIHLVSAYCREHGLLLGQEKVDSKSNEITAIPKLLELVNIKGSVISIDAIACQKSIVDLIIEKNANYVISLKGNQGRLHKAIKRFFQRHKKQDYQNMGYEFNHHKDVDSGHGRIEVRNITVLNQVRWLESADMWAGLASIAMVESTIEKDGIERIETRYFISSLTTNPKHMLEIIRGHWGIESMHYTLDVTFQEDNSRIRQRNATHNMAILRRVALNILKTADIPRKSIKSLRKRAGWDNSVLKKILIL
jgi:predicted transposase YbfD/YdcC